MPREHCMLSLDGRTRPDPNRSNEAEDEIGDCTQSDDMKTNLPPLVVYHYIVWFDVTVHYALGMAVVQGLRGYEEGWRYAELGYTHLQ